MKGAKQIITSSGRHALFLICTSGLLIHFVWHIYKNLHVFPYLRNPEEDLQVMEMKRETERKVEREKKRYRERGKETKRSPFSAPLFDLMK